jgi:hypothetical protein
MIVNRRFLSGLPNEAADAEASSRILIDEVSLISIVGADLRFGRQPAGVEKSPQSLIRTGESS